MQDRIKKESRIAPLDTSKLERIPPYNLEAEESLQSAEKYLNSRNYGVARREAIEAKTKAIDALRVSEASRENQN